MSRFLPAITHRLPDAPPRYSQTAEAQFRGVVQSALTSFNAELASEPAFLRAEAYLDGDGDLIFDYELNVPYGVSIAYGYDNAPPIVQPPRADILAGTADNYGENDASSGRIQIATDVVTDQNSVVAFSVIPFSAASAEGRPGTKVDFYLAAAINGGTLASGSVIADKLTDQGMLFTTDIVFSATDEDTVAWDTAANNLTLANGDQFTIAPGSVNMTQLTYIYFDRDTSATVLQTSVTYSSVIDDDVILLCVAAPTADADQEAWFVPGVGGFGINETIIGPSSVTTSTIKALAVDTLQLAANAITAAKISVVSLSAIDVTAYNFTGTTVTAGLFQNSSGARFINLEATGTEKFIEHDNFTLLANGTATFAGGGTFSGTVSATSFTGATATFTGNVSVKGSEANVSCKIITQQFQVLNAAGDTVLCAMLQDSNTDGVISASGTAKLKLQANDDIWFEPNTAGGVDYRYAAVGTAGSATGTYLQVKVNGTAYKIALLNT